MSHRFYRFCLDFVLVCLPFLVLGWAFATEPITFITTYNIHGSLSRLQVTLNVDDHVAVLEQIDLPPPGVTLPREIRGEWVKRAYLLYNSPRSSWVASGDFEPEGLPVKIQFGSVSPSEFMIGVRRQIFQRDSSSSKRPNRLLFHFDSDGNLISVLPTVYVSTVTLEWSSQNMSRQDRTPQLEIGFDTTMISARNNLLMNDGNGPSFIPYGEFIAKEWEARFSNAGNGNDIFSFAPYILNVSVRMVGQGLGKMIPIALQQVGSLQGGKLPVVFYEDLIEARNHLIEISNMPPNVMEALLKQDPRSLAALGRIAATSTRTHLVESDIIFDSETRQPRSLLPVMMIPEEYLDFVPLRNETDFRRVSKLGGRAEHMYKEVGLPVRPPTNMFETSWHTWAWALTAVRNNFTSEVRRFSLTDLTNFGLIASDRIRECKEHLEI